jgi:glutathione peroxidase
MRALPGFLLFAAVVSAPALAVCPPLLNHTFPSLTDKATPLCQFEGKVLLVVNTASQCGYTPQYEGLEALYRRYREKGLVVLGFPANDFGGQEPGGNRDIAKFCEVNYGVSFPMFAKSGVSAGNANPLYATLAVKTGERPQWNFHKYLIDRSGEKVLSFGSGVTPGDRKLVGEIERMLAAAERKP